MATERRFFAGFGFSGIFGDSLIGGAAGGEDLVAFMRA